MNPQIMKIVNEKLEEILEEAVFDSKAEQIFKLHYGIKCTRMEPKAIVKEAKIPAKRLKLELIRIDNKVFNILKKHKWIESEV